MYKKHNMSTSTPKKPAENEEIDLGVLFNAIGRGISNLFAAIGTAIMFVLNTILVFVIFVRKRTVYFIIACGVGFIAGMILENRSPKSYFAIATVEPHFDSARQLYSNVKYLNSLTTQNDTIQLASFFKISPAAAASIKKIEITPFHSKAQLLQAYNKHISTLDSMVALETNYEQYVKQLDKFETKTHMIRVESIQQDVFSQLLDPIITSVSAQDYFVNRQQTELKNLTVNDSITQVSIAQTDALLSTFEEVKLIEAKKEFSNGTNVIMSEFRNDNAEIALLDRKITLADRLNKVRAAKVEAQKVVEVISTFPEVGSIEKHFLKNKAVQGAIGGFLLVCLFYSVLYLDAFIESKNND